MIDNNEPLRIKRKGEDGYRLISVRIREDILDALDKMAADTHYSRNELINMILDHGAKNAIIEERSLSPDVNHRKNFSCRT